MNASPDTIPAHLRALIGEEADALDTPALVVDLDAANRNLQRMVEFAEKHSVRLRPHAKLYKAAPFAHLQLQAGAVGVCAQTVAEAEVLAAGGINDIFVSNEILSLAKLRRIAALAHRLKTRSGRLAITVDSAEGIKRLSQAMQLTHAPIDVFVEVDIGQGRCGVAPGRTVVELVRVLADRVSSLRYAGLQAYHGSAQHLRGAAERQAAITAAAERLRATRELLEEADLAPPLITGGGTGTFANEAASGLWGELQPGSFLFMDADYARNERDPAQPLFEQALFVRTQVISASADRVICDAGSKACALDSGPPQVATLPGQPALRAIPSGDEHTAVVPDGAGAAGGVDGALPALGSFLWLVPGHCDTTVNLHRHAFVIRGGRTEGVIDAVVPIAARGMW